MSSVWDVFTVDEKDKTKANCSMCSKKLSRGEDPRNRGTSNLRRHLQSSHREKWAELEREERKRKDANRE